MALAPLAASPEEDVVICAAVRTALCKSKKGPFKDTPPETLLTAVFKEALVRAKARPEQVQDVVVGNVLQPGAGPVPARMGQYLAGFPDSVSTMSVNRMCSSGLEACAIVAAKIKAGLIDVGIGAGVENMSMYDMVSAMTPSSVAD